MTLPRDAETRSRNRCTGWVSVADRKYQCDSSFCDSEGRHAGPHFHNERDDTGLNVRMTWQNARQPAPLPPSEGIPT